MKVWDRLKDFENSGKQPENGLFFNVNKFRLERIVQNKVNDWISVEALCELSTAKEKDLKLVILNTPEPMQSMLKHFFFSGWTINYYLKHGKQAEDYL